ncbi:MAG: thioredoxin family protein [Verrucomicrobiae bacterium]|nr:thioredoxin family protein [Verrucomicrobiae bacterium]
MKAVTNIVLVVFLMGATLEGRVWKEAGSDRTIEGELVRVRDGVAIIKKTDGRMVNVPLSKLSGEDQEFAKKADADGGTIFGSEKIEAKSQVFKWETDYAAALARAKAEKKHVLVDFTGSDWCGWCIRLKEEVFDQSAFKQYAKENLILVELDFPRGKELSKKLTSQNEELQQKFEVQGFPTIILLDSKGKEAARTGYKEGGADAYVEHLKGLIKNH